MKHISLTATKAFSYQQTHEGTYFEVICSIGAGAGVVAENWLKASELAFPAPMRGVRVEPHHCWLQGRHVQRIRSRLQEMGWRSKVYTTRMGCRCRRWKGHVWSRIPRRWYHIRGFFKVRKSLQKEHCPDSTVSKSIQNYIPTTLQRSVREIQRSLGLKTTPKFSKLTRNTVRHLKPNTATSKLHMINLIVTADISQFRHGAYGLAIYWHI